MGEKRDSEGNRTVSGVPIREIEVRLTSYRDGMWAAKAPGLFKEVVIGRSIEEAQKLMTAKIQKVLVDPDKMKPTNVIRKR